MKVWLAGDEIWQLQHQGRTLISYADVEARYRTQRRWRMALWLATMVGGACLAYWGTRAAPPDVGMFDR